MEEKWKKIKNFENYEISNLGNVRNKKKYILKQQKLNNYMTIKLYDKKRS